MSSVILFVLGAAIGSFLGVVGDRYQDNLPPWNKKVIGGRSRCQFCKAQLRWFELVPILSFLFQRGKCLTCGRKLSWRYPLVETASGLVFVFVPVGLKNIYTLYTIPPTLIFLWIFVFSILLLVFLIDARLQIIPDELEIALFISGIFIIATQPFDITTGSFLGNYSALFDLRSNAWINHLAAATIAGALFLLLILFTRGRGMGGGDMKLAAAVGWVFGWPDTIVILILSFVVGSIFGIGAIFFKKKKLKSRLAFGPFIALSALLVFFFGYQILKFYFGLLGL